MSKRPLAVAVLALFASLPLAAQNVSPTLPIAITAPRVLEGNAGFTPMPFVLRLPTSAALPTPVTVRYRTMDQSAMAGSDYVYAAGEVVFTANQREHTVIVQALGDTQVEGDEMFVLELSGPNQLIMRVPGLIQNDDGNTVTPGPNAIVPVGATVQEPAGGVLEARLPVRLLRPVATEVRINWSILGGSAMPGSDFTAASSGTLSFAPGAVLAEIPVRVLADTLVEPPERIRFGFSDPVGLPLGRDAADMTILDRSTVSPVAAGIAAVPCRPFVAEGDSARVLLRRLGNVANAASVDYATADGTAVAPDDYLAASGTISWAAGDGSHRLVTLQTLGDEATEAPEFFTLGFRGATGASWIGASAIRVIIRDTESISVDDLESLCNGEETEAALGMQ